MKDSPETISQDARGGVFSLGFLSLVATQFFVSLNDNMFRWLIVPIAKELMRERWHEMPAFIQQWMKPNEMALALGLACFTLPFLMLAAPAGFFADRFSKRKVMVVCKVVEFVILAVGITAILAGSVAWMFVVLFILGGQAMIFITSKLGAIPEIVRDDQLSAANGVMNMASMSAIILGAAAGSWLYDRTTPAGTTHWWYYAVALLGVAACGWFTSLFVSRVRAADPGRRIPWNPVKQTGRDLGIVFSHRAIFLATLGSAYFWVLGALSQVNIDQFATVHLGVRQELVGPLLAALTLGIAFGALFAGFVSRGKVELGLVPFGGIGIVISSILLAVVPGAHGQPAVGGYYATCFLLAAMGATAGLYDIPLQAFVQERSPVESRGSIMAAYNFMAFAGMLIASGVYSLLSGPLRFSSPAIFLVGGLLTLPVVFLIIWKLPYQTTRLFVRAIVASVYRVRVEGLENVPEGGAILASNHVSWADGILLGLACPRHPRMIAFSQYFESPWLGWFGRLTRIIPIGTTRKSMVESIRAARVALQQGELVAIFPEGGITRDGHLQEFRAGILTIIKDSDAPVVPVYLDGLWGSIFSYEGGRFFWKIPRRWPRRITIRFGRPILNPQDVSVVRRAVVKLEEGGERWNDADESNNETNVR